MDRSATPAELDQTEGGTRTGSTGSDRDRFRASASTSNSVRKLTFQWGGDMFVVLLLIKLASLGLGQIVD